MSEAAVAPSDPDRRARLLGAKLRALVTDQLGAHDPGTGASPEPAAFAAGSAVLAGRRAWVLLDDQPERRLGAALAWARRREVESLDIVVDDHPDRAAGTLARRAAEFDMALRVWTVAGGDRPHLVTAAAAPLPVAPAVAPEHLALRELIAAGGATPIVEHGVVLGEVRGLEVCRVVDGAETDGDPQPRLEVGLGVHDREAFQMLHGDVPTVESLSRIVDTVRMHRSDGADPHPLNRIARERYIRWKLEQDPASIAATQLAPADPPVPRPNLKDPVPCVARGIDADGGSVTVVCSAGVDLDLVPFVADSRLAAIRADADDVQPLGPGGDHRLVIVVPARDRLAVLDDLVALLRPVPGWSVEVRPH